MFIYFHYLILFYISLVEKSILQEIHKEKTIITNGNNQSANINFGYDSLGGKTAEGEQDISFLQNKLHPNTKTDFIVSGEADKSSEIPVNQAFSSVKTNKKSAS